MRKLALPLLLAGVWLALGVSPALATHVECGDVITTDTKLDSDLVNCPGDGLVIGADNVRLNLNGHTVDGPGRTGTDGIDDRSGFDGLTVANGEIVDFTKPVVLEGVEHSSIRRLRGEGFTVYLNNSSRNVIERNALAFLLLENDSDGNLIQRNRAVGPVVTPIFVSGGAPEDNLIRRNLFQGLGRVVMGVAPRTTIVDNRFIDVGTPTPGDPDDLAILVGIGAPDTLVKGNVITDGEGGISVQSATRVRVAHNRVTGTLTDGIVVTGPFGGGGVVVDRNVTNRNADDGIDFGPFEGQQPPNTTSTTISNNTANRNGDLGIEAVEEVTDGGGNRARRNGNPAQCTGVSCSN